METVTVSPKFQVVIPRSVRNALDIHPGTAVGVVVVDILISLLLAAITAAMLGPPGA